MSETNELSNMRVDTEKTNVCTVEYKDIMNKPYYCIVTEWTNGEGWDICLEGSGNSQIFQIHFDALSAINVGINTLNLNR